MKFRATKTAINRATKELEQCTYSFGYEAAVRRRKRAVAAHKKAERARLARVRREERWQ